MSVFTQMILNPVTESLTTLSEDVDLVVTDFLAPSEAQIGDEIDLSWTVTNLGTESATDFHYDTIYLSTDTIFDEEDDIYVTSNYAYDIASGASYTIYTSGFLPNSQPAGDYYLLVVTDADDNQTETDESNNVEYLPITLTIPDVDLVVSSVSIPSSTANIGESFDFSWTITNQGTETANTVIYNAVFLSEDNSLDDGDLVLSLNGINPLEASQSYTNYDFSNFRYAPTVGDYYLLFVTDYYNDQIETDENNNIEAVPLTLTAPNVDLVLTSIVAPSSVVIGVPFDISWTVTNQGTEATTIPSWEDRAYYSFDDIFGGDLYLGTPVAIGDDQGLPLAPGESYTVNASVELNTLGAGDYYLFVEADSLNYQPETDEDNNVKAIPLTVTTPDVDLVTSDVSTPTTAAAGDTIDLSWTVTNEGTDATTVPYWFDYVLLSTDTVYDFIFSPNPDLSIASYSPSDLPLAPGEGYTVNQSAIIPNVAPGNYYLLFGNNAYDFQPDTNLENDVVVVPFTVTEELDGADLDVSYVSAPTSAGAGQEIALSWTVTNEGIDTTTAPYWYDYVLLSTDTTVDFLSSPNPDISITLEQLAEFDGELPLAAGESYTIDQSGTIPSYVQPGDYYLLFVSDIYNSEDETDESNNVVAVPFTVPLSTSNVDLVTDPVSTPTVATAGSEIDVSWTVTNQGTDPTTAPYWYDYVLLSTDTTVDFFFSPTPDTSITLGSLSNGDGNIPLAPGESYTFNSSGTIPNYVQPGLYYLLFVNDIYNSQVDINPGNDVVVVPFSVVQNSMVGTAASDSSTGTDESESIEALEGRDRITANGGDDVIVGGTGGDTLTGGDGADRFIYRVYQDIGDTITDFTVNQDTIDISELLDSFSYGGSDPVTDGYLRWVQGSNGTSVQLDTDGSTGIGIFRPFIFLENVTADSLSLSDFIV